VKEVGELLPQIEAELEPFGVRPHWGKLFTIPSQTLRARYSRYDDFVKLAGELDPDQKFSNDYLKKNIFQEVV
jgi:xylitol oxidase